MEKVPDSVCGELIETLRESADQTAAQIVKKRWKSAACMSCGACCCSSVIPIAGADLAAFHARLETRHSLPEFTKMFVADPETNAPAFAIETGRYGGRCMFLGRRRYFFCDAWEKRPEVCRDFFCWEMTCFEKWLDGQAQDMFKPGAPWVENFSALLTKITTESPLSVFPDDMVRYLRLLALDDSPSWSETHI